ncbi:lipoprotein [Spiroplasma citri]|uniref:lipoprotein n=1 Tax=Spiroplasma citri TaxID=2133 RepID=UPI002412A1C8|nr:lipoprotein [Spiroplasma citri]WFG97712.1 lipoprotein [Spiroplasma citri]
MKKWLSIIGAIGLTATSTTTLISCKKENNNKNEEDNKPKPSYNAQQPPENSNWKLINYKYVPRDTGWYIIIYESFNLWRIEKINSSKNFGSNTGYPMDIIYKWELNNEPTNLQIPTIDKNTGEITDWKEQKGT